MLGAAALVDAPNLVQHPGVPQWVRGPVRLHADLTSSWIYMELDSVQASCQPTSKRTLALPTAACHSIYLNHQFGCTLS